MQVRRTRWYTYTWKTYHRDKSCSYLKKILYREPEKLNSFLAYEPIKPGGPVEYKQTRITGKVDVLKLKPCPRCG